MRSLAIGDRTNPTRTRSPLARVRTAIQRIKARSRNHLSSAA